MICLSRTTLALLAIAALSVPAPVFADERPEHFEGDPAATVTEARDNLSRGHQELEALLSRDSLSPEDLLRVHQLTYTLENALARLGEELERSAAALEEVHLASERNDPDTVRAQSATYLEAIRKLVDD